MSSLCSDLIQCFDFFVPVFIFNFSRWEKKGLKGPNAFPEPFSKLHFFILKGQTQNLLNIKFQRQVSLGQKKQFRFPKPCNGNSVWNSCSSMNRSMKWKRKKKQVKVFVDKKKATLNQLAEQHSLLWIGI